MTKLPILIPLPNHDYDPSEVAVSWKIITQAGFDVVFATKEGKQAQADPLMLSGEGLDPWGWLPLFKKILLIGLLLRANRYARHAHREMLHYKSFQNPLPYDKLQVADYAGLILPGGHAPRMRQYLEDKTLQSFVADFFDQNNEALASKSMVPKPVGAICHGVVLAARAISKQTGKSVLFGKQTTALTWKLEKSAWDLTRFYARFWDSNYYRTYQEKSGEEKGYHGVQQEVTRALASDSDFLDVPNTTQNFLFKTLGIFRDSTTNSKPAWVVQDGYYLSARWPGDVNTFAKQFVSTLKDGH